MENDRPKGEDKPSESKKLSFLETWQQRLGLVSEINPDEDQESLEEDDLKKKESRETKKGKKWQSLFSRVFSGIVKPAPIESTLSKEENIIFKNTEPVAGEEILAEIPENPPTQELINDPDAEINDSGDSPSESSLNRDTETLQKPQELVEEVALNIQTDTEPPKSFDNPEQTSSKVIASLQQDMEIPIYKRPDTVPTTKTEVQEHIIEKGGKGVAVAAGLFSLEFFARRRADRKIRQEIKRLDQRVNRGDTEMSPQTTEANHTTAESRASQSLSVPEKKVPATETATFSTAEVQLPQEAENMLGQKAELSRNLASETRVDLEKPEKVLEKVAKAAEKNVPIEKLFERSHEIKDEPSQHLGAAPVGVILSSSGTENQSAFTAATNKIIEAQQKAMSNSYEPNRPNLYKQAIKSGFWTAVVLIACISVLITFNN